MSTRAFLIVAIVAAALVVGAYLLHTPGAMRSISSAIGH